MSHDFKDLADQQLALSDRYGILEDHLDKSEAEDYVKGLPAEQTAFTSGQFNQELIPIFWDRLWRLGYLAHQATKTQRYMMAGLVRKAGRPCRKSLPLRNPAISNAGCRIIRSIPYY